MTSPTAEEADLAAVPAPTSQPGPRRSDTAVAAMLEAGSVALVGASPRDGSFGMRLLTELERSPSQPEIHLVNPRYDEVAGRRCVASLDELHGPVDLVLLGVGDAALEAELARAARRGDRSAVIYGSAVDPSSPADSSAFRARLGSIAREAGMALCGAGCMGFVNVSAGLRAIGYLERDPLEAGSIALVTHSGSAFSALLRADRPFRWSLAVSSGQELVTTTADYLHFALDRPETRLVALLLETLRDPDSLRAALRRAAAAEVPVVALTVGSSQAGQAMVAAHSGALAGSDATWEALFDAFDVIRVGDLGEMCDTLELFSSPRRPARRNGPGGGAAAVLDSGAERALVVDVASEVGLGFSEVGAETIKRLETLLDPGLAPTNPLDVWGTGSSTEELFAESLLALADDESVDAVALAVDLVPELDGDDSYQRALVRAFEETTCPMCVVSNLPSALDRPAASELRARGIPVLEGTRSGLLALRHLLDWSEAGARRRQAGARNRPPVDNARRQRWLDRLTTRAAGDPRRSEPLTAEEAFELLADYGLTTPAVVAASERGAVLEAGERLGYPVVLKTDVEGLAHKSDAKGVVLGLGGPDQLAAAYDEIAARLGPAVTVSEQIHPGVELVLGLVRDPLLGPLVVVGAGGVLVELLADRAVGLPPLGREGAARLLGRLRVRRLLDGFRGLQPADLEAIYGAVEALSSLAVELGEVIEALDVNPLSCGPSGAVALDVLVETAPAG